MLGNGLDEMYEDLVEKTQTAGNLYSNKPYLLQ